RAELVARRRQVLLGVHGHLPGDDLAGVGGHAAHDGHERALGHPLAVVDGLARADAGEQLVVLDLVHVLGLGLGPPARLAGGRRPDLPHAAAGQDVAGAPGAEQVVGNVVGAAGLLAAVAEQLHAVGVLVNHRVVVEDVAELRAGAHLPAAGADGL